MQKTSAFNMVILCLQFLNKIKKQILALICIITVLIGCNEADMLPPLESDDVKVENGRLVFRDIDHFFKTVGKINKMNNQELMSWEKSYKFKSLSHRMDLAHERDSELSAEELDYSKFPLGYLMILNDAGEVRIGDKLVRYNNGVKYYAASEEELESVKSNPATAREKGEYRIERKELDQKGSADQRINLNIGSIDARYQKEFQLVQLEWES
jgi:hypothetical protein